MHVQTSAVSGLMKWDSPKVSRWHTPFQLYSVSRPKYLDQQLNENDLDRVTNQ